MRIAFDLRRINNPGIGRYMKCLVNGILRAESENEYVLVIPLGAESLIARNGGNVDVVVTDLKYYSVSEQVKLPAMLRERRAELLHSPHFLLPLLKPCPAVVTIHDVIYLSCPQDLPSPVGRLYYAAMMKSAARVADRIITDSEFSKRDIERYLKANPNKIDVIYPGVDPSMQPVKEEDRLRAVRAKYGVEREFILYTSIYKLRKNHVGLLRAFRHFLDLGADAQLVLAGPLDGGESKLKTVAQTLKVADRVLFAGFVDDDDLPALYTAARVYACPSLYEGFGFTLLEAMACETPVVCAPETSLPEVGGEAALYADAWSAEEFGDALFRAFHDEELRQDLIRKGVTNLSRFSWERTAEQTLSVYRRALGLPTSTPVYA